jgi:protein Hikeshi
MAVPQFFGIVPTGCPVIISPSSAPSETSFIFTLPARVFEHIAVFLLPGVTLPPDTAAAAYLAIPGGASSSSGTNFKFLGGIGPGKESAIFRISGANTGLGTVNSGNGEVDMDAPEGSTSEIQNHEMILGISIEASSSVAAKMAALSAARTVPTVNEPSNALVATRPQVPNTLQLAQKIIKNAFNFLASFSGNVPVPGATGTAGVEVIPLKAFEDWWKKFEGRLRSDPGFLERDSD